MTLKDEIRQRAAAEGMDVFGVASVDAPPEGGELLQRWLAMGFHGTMAWMERNNDLRLAPARLFPAARSILFFGADSRRLAGADTVPAGAGYRVARYAQDGDYHKILGKRLKRISAFLAEKGGEQRACVDTAPVMEKLLAARAGLGWQGRSTLLIHPRHGPWLLLGAIFTSLPLPPDTPRPPRCGTCVRCVQTCPTGALDGSGALDARRCVAYLTIEHEGSIPPALRPLLGNHLFGCDSCLESCPWGSARLMPAKQESPLSPKTAVTETASPPPPVTARFPAHLRDSLSWDEAEFARRFNGTPLKRSGLHRWLRNACVVLGNTGAIKDIPALHFLAHSASPHLAEHAQWAVSQINKHPAATAASGDWATPTKIITRDTRACGGTGDNFSRLSEIPVRTSLNDT